VLVWCVPAALVHRVESPGQGTTFKIGLKLPVSGVICKMAKISVTIPQNHCPSGEKLFTAKWTIQEAKDGRNTKGTGPAPPLPIWRTLVFPHNFKEFTDRCESCSGCHTSPSSAGAVDHVTDVFVARPDGSSS